MRLSGLNAMISRAAAGIRIAGDVSRGIDPLHAAPQQGVDQHPVVHAQPRRLGQPRVGSDSDSDHDEVGSDLAAIVQHYLVTLDDRGLPAQAEARPLPLVRGTQRPPQLLPQGALEGDGIRRDDGDLQAARAERCRGLHADEAGPQHDRPTSRSRGADDRTAIVQRAQHVHVGKVRAG